MTDRETGRWPAPRGEVSSDARESLEGETNPRKEQVVRRSQGTRNTPGLVGGETPWSRPVDAPERASTDGEGTTEPARIPRIRAGPEIHRANESSVTEPTPETGGTTERRSSRNGAARAAPNLRCLPRPRGRRRAPRHSPTRSDPDRARSLRGDASVGDRTRRSSERARKREAAPMPELRRPEEVGDRGRNAASDDTRGRRAVHFGSAAMRCPRSE